MISTLISSTRWARIALLSVGCALVGVVLSASQAKAEAAAAAMPALPVTVTFAKVTGDGGPIAATVANSSKEAVHVSGKVLLAVAFHAENKARAVPAQTIAPGKTIAISGLAAGDKLVLMADGFAPMTVEVK